VVIPEFSSGREARGSIRWMGFMREFNDSAEVNTPGGNPAAG
jgi:hypothetical protein